MSHQVLVVGVERCLISRGKQEPVVRRRCICMPDESNPQLRLVGESHGVLKKMLAVN